LPFQTIEKENERRKEGRKEAGKGERKKNGKMLKEERKKLCFMA